MKHRLIPILLIFLLIFTLGSAPAAKAASADVILIATNNEVLEHNYTAVYQGSVLYVPAEIFVNFRIYNAYSASESVASLYNSTKQYFFNITTGETYDLAGDTYYSSAIMRNGTVYVPVDFVCSQFGLSWSYLYADPANVCRIKDDSVILTDSRWLDAAGTVLQGRYNDYVKSLSGTLPSTPGGIKPPEEDGCAVYLSFQGLPSDALLELLRARELLSCFFISGEDILQNPDTVRRLVGEGHGIGILCSDSPEAEYERGSELLFEAARVKTVLIASAAPESDASCRFAADSLGLVFCGYEIDGVAAGAGVSYPSRITAYLPYYPSRVGVRVLCSESSDKSMASVLNFIEQNSYNLHVPRETDN